MNTRRLRLLLILAIGVTMITMAVGVVYLSTGYLTDDPAVKRLLAPIIPIGFLLVYIIWRIWLHRQLNPGRKVRFMQGYRRKYPDEE